MRLSTILIAFQTRIQTPNIDLSDPIQSFALSGLNPLEYSFKSMYLGEDDGRFKGGMEGIESQSLMIDIQSPTRPSQTTPPSSLKMGPDSGIVGNITHETDGTEGIQNLIPVAQSFPIFNPHMKTDPAPNNTLSHSTHVPHSFDMYAFENTFDNTDTSKASIEIDRHTDGDNRKLPGGTAKSDQLNPQSTNSLEAPALKAQDANARRGKDRETNGVEKNAMGVFAMFLMSCIALSF